jgi:hypothetical protein
MACNGMRSRPDNRAEDHRVAAYFSKIDAACLLVTAEGSSAFGDAFAGAEREDAGG